MFVLLFDIDGTLLVSLGAGRKGMERALLTEFGITQPQPVEMLGRPDYAIGLEMLRLHDIPATDTNWHHLRDAYLSHLPNTLAECPGEILPGVKSLLAELAGRDQVHLGLLTGNLRRGAELKLGHYGIWDHFCFGGFGDRHLDRDGVAHEAWGEVNDRFGAAGWLHRDRVLVIGDTPRDIRCARAIGCQAIAVATGGVSVAALAEHEPDLLLDDLADPAPLLQWLDGGGSSRR